MSWPEAQVEITSSLVESLLREQRPGLVDLGITEVALGFDNSIWRIGEELVARLPRRDVAATLLRHELRWLPVIAPGLTLPTPVALFEGEPSASYPWPWSVSRWMPGDPGDQLDAGQRRGSARPLGEFLRSLHRPAPPEAPANHFRGIPLDNVAESFARRLGELDSLIDARRVLALWYEAVLAHPWGGPRTWLHGDLHPANLIFDGGRLSGIIDFGDVCGGDPASDIAGGFLSLPFDALEDFLDAYGPVDAETLTRSLGWTLHFGLMFLSLGLSGHESYGRVGALAIDNALAFTEASP